MANKKTNHPIVVFDELDSTIRDLTFECIHYVNSFFFTINFGIKGPVLDKHQKNFLVVLTLSIVTEQCTF
jgi:hypothetical protein